MKEPCKKITLAPPPKSITGPTPDPRGFPVQSAIHDAQFMIHATPTNWAYDDELAREFARFKRLQAEFDQLFN